MSFAFVNASEPDRVQTENDSFDGVIRGSSLTLAFSQGLGLNKYTSDDGTIATQIFVLSSVEEYNAAVAELERQAAANSTPSPSPESGELDGNDQREKHHAQFGMVPLSTPEPFQLSTQEPVDTSTPEPADTPLPSDIPLPSDSQ
jgi:hypothetical protein